MAKRKSGVYFEYSCRGVTLLSGVWIDMDIQLIGVSIDEANSSDQEPD